MPFLPPNQQRQSTEGICQTTERLHSTLFCISNTVKERSRRSSIASHRQRWKLVIRPAEGSELQCKNSLLTTVAKITPWARKKAPLFFYDVIWQNLVLLLLRNIIIDVTCLISGIYANLHIFLCKKCDEGYYVINHGVYRWLCYRLVFIVSISLLRKIPNACRNKIHGIVAYTFLNVHVREKIHQFLSGIKKMHTKENWFIFQHHGVLILWFTSKKMLSAQAQTLTTASHSGC